MNSRLIEFKILGQTTSPLVSLESNKNVPFAIARIYYLFGTRRGITRGGHAHKTLKQLLVCVRGRCRIRLDDGTTKEEHLLDRPEVGLYTDSMIWGDLYDFSEDCVLLVLADQPYEESDYIRNYEEFRKQVGKEAN
jgi:dTDP-4-dehydrorhamnose 3,5-epimerase-like enzyme